jgi:hypothetical protein
VKNANTNQLHDVGVEMERLRIFYCLVLKEECNSRGKRIKCFFVRIARTGSYC